MDAELRKKMIAHQRNILPFISKYLKNKKILDVGCGTGLNSVFFNKELKSRPTLLDIYDLRETPAKIFPFLKKSLTKIPAQNREFDVSFVQFVFHHVSVKLKIKDALSELRRVTKENIIIIEETITKDSDIKSAMEHDLKINSILHPSLPKEKVRFYTDTELKQFFLAANLEIILEKTIKTGEKRHGGLLNKLYVLNIKKSKSKAL